VQRSGRRLSPPLSRTRERGGERGGARASPLGHHADDLPLHRAALGESSDQTDTVEVKSMWDRLLQQAPQGFGEDFLKWVQELENVLLIRFATWKPADPEAVRNYARIINRQVPEEVQLYYEHADPVSFLRDGWLRWEERMQEYQTVWTLALEDLLHMSATEARALVATSEPLWPINCFEGITDDVAFAGDKGETIVMELRLGEKGRGKLLAVGLRNYFLRYIVLEALAENEMEPVDFDRLARRQEVLKSSGYSSESLIPRHVAFLIDKLMM